MLNIFLFKQILVKKLSVIFLIYLFMGTNLTLNGSICLITKSGLIVQFVTHDRSDSMWKLCRIWTQKVFVASMPYLCPEKDNEMICLGKFQNRKQM